MNTWKRIKEWEGGERAQESQRSENYKRLGSVNAIKPAMSAGQPSEKLGFLLPIKTGKQGPYSSLDYFPKERLRDLWERQRYIFTLYVFFSNLIKK